MGCVHCGHHRKPVDGHYLVHDRLVGKDQLALPHPLAQIERRQGRTAQDQPVRAGAQDRHPGQALQRLRPACLGCCGVDEAAAQTLGSHPAGRRSLEKYRLDPGGLLFGRFDQPSARRDDRLDHRRFPAFDHRPLVDFSQVIQFHQRIE